MNDAKENPTEFVAYLSYVRDLWIVSDKVSRQIVRFYYLMISRPPIYLRNTSGTVTLPSAF